MHQHPTEHLQHAHNFLGAHHERNERKAWLVIGLASAMMVAEIACGTLFHSMALVADGWHMSTHAGALTISALAYTYARRHKHDARFAFGTGKMGELAGFSSAIILAAIAIMVAYESVGRLLSPVPIAFGEAIAVAALGLIVNIASAWLLHDSEHEHGLDHDHEQAHEHGSHKHGHHHHDHNIRSAYVHVLADAATSLLAILGLSAGWAYGWVRMDAMMGIVGACVIINWSFTLMRDTGRVLLDMTPDEPLKQAIGERLEGTGDKITDLHLWQVGPGHYGAIISLVSDEPLSPDIYKEKLAGMKMLSHVTVEVFPCRAAQKRA